MLLPVIRPLHSYSVSNYLLFILFFVFLISTALICEPQIIFLVSFELSHVLC